MAAQRTRAALLVENIANSETTRTPEGGPYRRKDAIFSTTPVGSEFASELNSQMQTGVQVSGISIDQREPEKQYAPGHPDADANGYVHISRFQFDAGALDSCLMPHNRRDVSRRADLDCITADRGET